MENYIKMATKLYVAVNEKGEIVNSNDFKDLGPAFALEDTKVIIENGEVVKNYALHIDYNFNKQGAFSILNCSKITAAKIARLYCEKHDLLPQDFCLYLIEEDRPTMMAQYGVYHSVTRPFHLFITYNDKGKHYSVK